MNEVFTNIQMQLKEELDEKRYEHTIGVMYTAASLAMRYGVMMHQAILAGLLHDCAKAIPNDEKLRLCEENDILISSVERENPFLLHAKLGALLAKTEYENSVLISQEKNTGLWMMKYCMPSMCIPPESRE